MIATKKTIRKTMVLTVITAFLVPLLMPTGALAGRKHHAAPRVKRIYHHPLSVLPRGFITIHLGGIPYFFHHGIFYKQHRGGFVVTPPPLNIVIPALPLGHAVVNVGGITYFVLGDVYYRKVPRGFMVVQAPVPQPAQPTPNVKEQKVAVTADRLNVRSGPGLEHPVIFQVSRGTVLNVYGNAPDWYYVRLPDGHFGWVMAKFAAALSPPAEG